MNSVTLPMVLRIIFALLLGLLSPVVAFIAGSVFEVKGENSFREIFAACIAAALFLAFSAFWLAPRGRHGLNGKCPTLIALLAPLGCLLPWFDRHMVLVQGLPLLAAGGFGAATGALIVGRKGLVTASGSPAAPECSQFVLAPRNFWVGFFLVLAIAIVIAVGIIPPVKADRSPMASPQQAADALWIVAGVNLLIAALLACSAVWSAKHARMTAGLLGAWAILSFLLALTLLAPATGYLDHGTAAMRTASVLLFFCVGAELLGAGLSTVTRAAADRTQSTPL